MLRKLWNDDGGALIATEWTFVATILVLGAITGLVAVRQAVITELEEVATAVMSLSQSYSFSGQSNCEATTGGSQFQDAPSLVTTVGVNAESASLAPALPCD
jgi:Flp pilus assembly pilin Flp